MQDPISDLLTRIRNGYSAKKDYVIIPLSKVKLSIIKLLIKENFLKKYIIVEQSAIKFQIKIFFKYYGNGVPVMRRILRVSKPSVRVYSKNKNLPRVLNGFGIAIISTSHGLFTDNEARKLGYGGEILCIVE